MNDIFLSYASEDRERVRPLAEALTQEGWFVFWDRIIPVGKTWHEMLEEELEAARSLLVVWSENSIKSKWVRIEAGEGLRKEVPLFPVLLDGVLPPLEFRDIQAADFSAWDNTAESALFQNLARDIKKILGAPEPPEPTETKIPEPELIEPEPLKPKPAEPSFHTKPSTPRRRRVVSIVFPAGLVLVLLMVGLWWFLLGGSSLKISSPEREAGQRPFPPLGRHEPMQPANYTITNSIGMKFVLIPAGTFQMGSPADESGRDDDERQHQVKISQPFYLQTTEVTQGQWQKVMGNNPSDFKKCGKDCPVENVSWEHAQEFIKELNRMEKTDKYRLPTEAEWEYACRAGNTTTWYFGDDEAKLAKFAWYRQNSQGSTHPGTQLRSNVWGLYDMHGNVWEWCQDWYGKYPVGSVTDPQGPHSGVGRVLRGGSWFGLAKYTRSAERGRASPDLRKGQFDGFGFRVSRDL